MSRMTLDEKIGQMMQADLSAISGKLDDITIYRLGSILSGGDADPAAGNSAMSWRAIHDTVQSHALKTLLKIPMIYGIDAVHGHSNVYGATIFPHNIGLGCTRDSALIRHAARVTAEEMAATGIRWNFGPMVGAPRDIRWGRTYEGFGETPELARLGAVQVLGLQGDSLNSPTSVLACSKHFLADGGTAGGVDQGNTVGDEATIRNIHLPGYISSLQYGVGSIMVSFSSINGEKMHGSKHWLTDVLKTELGFKGFLVSDWAAIDQLGADYTHDVETSINAGIDMVMLPSRYADFRAAMHSLVDGGKVTVSRIDDAVRRILTAKFALGLFEHPFADSTLIQSVGSAEHRAVARQCVRESMVLLKRKDGVLPMSTSGGRIIVAGSHADNIGYQCGGWTITWQGGSGSTTIGTTILAGMKKVAPAVQIDYSATGDFTDTKAEYSVVVIGETPYAEGRGDRKDLGIQGTDVDLIKKMKSFGNPVVVIIVSGRPLIMEKILHYSDAIVAAWLPGTEGDGIAEVLFGLHNPKGLLSHSLPRIMAQIPINIGDPDYAPLYSYGYGITSYDNSPSGSPPSLLSGIVKEDGRHVELTFDKAMKDPSSSQASMLLTRNNLPLISTTKVALKPGDSTTIIVESDSTFTRHDTVKVSYISGNIQSVDGGTLTPFGPEEVYNWVRSAPVSLPARIEAEDFADMFGVEVEPTSDSDGGSNVTAIDDGDWLEYAITAQNSGYFTLSLRIASATAVGNVSILVNNVSRASRSLPVTGSWNTWTTVKQVVPILAGNATLRLSCTKGGFKLNWLLFETVVGVSESDGSPTLRFALEQNYPSPFNPSTTIAYSLKDPGSVDLKVYDVLGQEVETLVDKFQPAGRYRITFDGSHLPSGVYFCRLQQGMRSEVRRLVLCK